MLINPCGLRLITGAEVSPCLILCATEILVLILKG